jgi:hypothetical protein
VCSEGAKHRADALLLRRENETQAAELRRLHGATAMDGDRRSTVEAELKYVKSAAAAEAQRQAGRVAELEALNAVLRTQLDAAGDADASTQVGTVVVTWTLCSASWVAPLEDPFCSVGWWRP